MVMGLGVVTCICRGTKNVTMRTVTVLPPTGKYLSDALETTIKEAAVDAINLRRSQMEALTVRARKSASVFPLGQLRLL